MVTVLSCSEVDRKCEPVKPKTIKLAFCCFSAKHGTLKNKTEDRLVRYQDNVSEWRDMSSSLTAVSVT